MMKRRGFLKTSALGIGALSTLGLPLDLYAKDKGLQKLTILHTNDMHSWIEPYTQRVVDKQIWEHWLEELIQL